MIGSPITEFAQVMLRIQNKLGLKYLPNFLLDGIDRTKLKLLIRWSSFPRLIFVSLTFTLVLERGQIFVSGRSSYSD